MKTGKKLEHFQRIVIAQSSEEIPKLALRPKHAAIALSIGKTKLIEMADSGQIPSITLSEGKNKSLRIFPVDRLKDWLQQQSASN